VCSEGLRQVLNQRGKKLLARFHGSAFEDRAQCDIGFKILERLGGIS